MEMELDVIGIIGACSYALDCVEAELIHVTNKHAKRVAYMSVCTAEEMGIGGNSLQDLAVCALLHDNALTQYIQDECNGNITDAVLAELPHKLGLHCSMGEENIKKVPFNTDVTGVILYHHENADGSGPFEKCWNEIPVFARIIHMCDLLDAYCKAETFTEEIWENAVDFLEKSRGDIVDQECLDAFFRAFTKERFMALGNNDFEDRLWEKVPRTKQTIEFPRVKMLADFFAQIVDYKSQFTSTHSMGVAESAEKMARFMGFDQMDCQKMYLAGALHDIGKVAVGNEILEKPGKLTDEEFAVMKDHASFTYYILNEVDDFQDMRDWAAFHHERLDGSGYPFGKTAAELNTQERIMACVDIYQALTESRPYKDGMPHEKACSILRDMAGRGWLDAGIAEQVDKCFKE